MQNKLQKIFLERNITNISSDSRKIKPNDAFFAIKGENFNGNQHISQALKFGASIAFTDDPSKTSQNVIYVENIRKALALASEILYNKIPKNLVVVTGTNGKSSVVSYVHQILMLLSRSSAALGTLGVETSHDTSTQTLFNQNTLTANLTSTDPISFRRILTKLYDCDIENIAFEASSHGIEQERLANIKATSAAFTSFSQDHLDYHGSMLNYLYAKLRLFHDHLSPNGEAVINGDILPSKQEIASDSLKYIASDYLKRHKIHYTIVSSDPHHIYNENDIYIIKSDQSLSSQQISFKFLNKEYSFETNIIGSFQAINILIAAKLVCNLGIEFHKIFNILSQIQSVKGRLQRITELKSKYQIFVDYAHTPDALKKTLQELQNIKSQNGKLYIIFGCGGDREKTKRPIMGKIASQIADIIVITDDNPRTEYAATIRGQIIAGIKPGTTMFEINDRENAIKNIIDMLRQDDILLIAGKGHEEYQVIGNKTVKFSDIEIAYNNIVKKTHIPY